MKNNIRNLSVCLITLLAIIVNRTKAQENQFPSSKFHIVSDKITGSNEFLVDSIAIKWHKPYFIAMTVSRGYTVLRPNINGEMEFELPYEPEPSPFLMMFFKNGKYERIVTGYFVADSGDKVEMKISAPKVDGTNLSIFFNGKGSEKYNLAIELHKMKYELGLKKIEIMNGQVDLKLKLNQVNEIYLEYKNRGVELIERSKISNKMKKVVTFEYYTLTQDWQFDFYDEFKKSKDLHDKKVIRDAFNNYKDNMSYQADSLVGLAPSSTILLAWRESLDLSINASTDTVRLEDMYSRLKNKYSGKVRDLLLANFFAAGVGFTQEILNGYNQVVLDSLAKEATDMVTLPSAKQRLIEQMRLSRGSAVTNESFIDLQGNKVSLDSFKGKVVMLDFWGTGCSACAIFHKWFHKEVYPKYKEDKDFVYLSVNGDRTKKQWEAALKTGHYSSDDYVNLNMDSRGFSHPFAKYYNMSAFPFLMVIDKNGKVYAESIPENKDVAMKILDGALAEKVKIGDGK